VVVESLDDSNILSVVLRLVEGVVILIFNKKKAIMRRNKPSRENTELILPDYVVKLLDSTCSTASKTHLKLFHLEISHMLPLTLILSKDHLTRSLMDMGQSSF
jgi:hypothetical protein